MQVKVALKTIFNNAERFLLRNNQVFVLNSSSSNDDQSSESEIDKKDFEDKGNYKKSRYFKALLEGVQKNSKIETQ